MKQKSTRVLFRYIRAFILVLLVPVFVMITMYYQVMHSLQTQAYHNTVRTIKSSAEAMEKIFQKLPLIAYSLSTDEKLLSFISLENYQDNPTVMSDVLQAQKRLGTYSVAYSDISCIQIYSQKSNMIIDSTSSGVNLERYYGLTFYLEGISEQEWEKDYLHQTFHNQILLAKGAVRLRSGKEGRLIYAQTLREIDGDANVFIYLKEADLLSQYSALQYQEEGFVSVSRQEDQELLLYDNPSGSDFQSFDQSQMTQDAGYVIQNLNGKEMLITYMINHTLGWKYVVAVPVATLLQPLSEIRNAIAAMIAFTVFLAFMLSLMAAYRVSKPERSIYESLMARHPGAQITGKQLNLEIAGIISRNETMQKELQLQQSVLRNAVVNNFLSGMFTDKEEMRLRFTQCGMDIQKGIYGLLIFKMQIPQGYDAQKLLIREIVINNIPNYLAISDLDTEKTALLLNSPSADIEGFKTAVNQGMKQCIEALQRLSIRAINVHGLVTTRLSVIPPMFTHIKIEMDQKPFDAASQEIIWYELTELGSSYYPLEMELKLISAVREGNIQSLMRSFQHLYSVNSALFTDTQMRTEAYQLIEAVYATLLRHNILSGTSEKHEILKQIKAGLSPEDVYQTLRGLYVEAALETAKPAGKVSEKEDIIAYIEENFTDPQISLRLVAERFHVSEVYFSKLFKQEAGMNFVKYLEKLRIKRSEELLKSAELKVCEVARLVGYNSPQVFRRAQKRFYSRNHQGDSHDEI